MSEAISNSQDIIDSRDVIARIAELEGLRDDADDNTEAEKFTDANGDVVRLSDEYGEDEHTELLALSALADEASGYAPDWKYGEALIRDSYFEDYARELAEDIGAVKRDDPWPTNCIDWEKATSELQQDYTAVDFDGETYWIR